MNDISFLNLSPKSFANKFLQVDFRKTIAFKPIATEMKL